MRIKLTLSKPNFIIPLTYQSKLQGLIYSLLSKSEIGNHYHNEGYRYDKKVFKCFVFSQLFGQYKIVNKNMIFDDDFYFYISSQDENFLKEIYHTLNQNEFVLLNNELVSIKDIQILDLSSFSDKRTLTIKTLSPILIYSTTDNYSTYYKPSDKEAQQYLINNIRDKAIAYDYPLQELCFHIDHVYYEKKRMVKYKDCIYPAYLSEIDITVNFETLLFIYNCGLSSKGSCGFGMIEVINEKNHISI